MTTIYFVRHATPDLRNKSEDRKLSQKGVEDSKWVCKYLEDKHIDVFISSPYKRSIQTIEPLAKSQKKDIVLIDDLRERKIGKWLDDFDAFSKKQWEDFNHKMLDGESLNEVQLRNIHALKNILDAYENQTVCIGTHGTALSLVINHYQNSFQYYDFNRIKDLMPWMIKITFQHQKMIEIKEIDFRILEKN